MLTRRLGGLERDGIVSRHVRSQALRKVECLPTEYEVTVIPVLASLYDWGFHPLGIPMILE
jgi:DNA-binding HxlR family transcriptional regulator